MSQYRKDWLLVLGLFAVATIGSYVHFQSIISLFIPLAVGILWTIILIVDNVVSGNNPLNRF